MSKLAAICAKLKSDAVSASSDDPSTVEDVNADNATSLPLFPPPPHLGMNGPADDDDSRMSGGARPITPTSISSLSSTNLDSTIGLLKRKSIMSGGGASRRKKHRPSAAVEAPLDAPQSNSNSVWVSAAAASVEDNNSVDGSEHSLHIDLAPENVTENKDREVSRSPFHQYTDETQISGSQADSGVLQALGLTGLTPSDPNSSLASQSLAALAQQACGSQIGNDMLGVLRGVSPSSFSGDSLNDSHGQGLLVSACQSEKSGKSKKIVDYKRYLARYSNSEGCGSSYCRGMNYREHYHCLDCHSRIFVKKEEMIRHYKWHKKREDSLQHGFMRYSPFDDCTPKFGPCAHNKKQTHYHCIQAGCNKVYVSTSDVQMHANYHRKASAIIMEGFQRFRATEDCGTPSCDFYSQRTTHFHCRRQACNFTFKNKADMEKHKTYHQKDEILAKDGFKKYMKYEHCPYPGCAYSKLSNHIHCMRPGCQYVLHSTSQLYPHKRKHEKRGTDLSLPNQSSPAPPTLSTAPPILSVAPPTLSVAPPTLTAAPGVLLPSSGGGTSDRISINKTNPPTASDLLSTVARLSQGLMPLVKPSSEGERAPPINPFVPAAKAKQPTALMNSCTSAGAASLQTEILNQVGDVKADPDASGSQVNKTPVSEEESGSEGNNDSSSDQIFDKSLNLTPGRVLEPAAMNWKTEKSTRLSEQAKSMMGHFKIGSGDAQSTNNKPSDREKSELWKKYLTRYTANDPCNPRCWLLYKDHYHCNVDKCFNAFKSKDGVRDHARLHDNQEKISEQLYSGYSEEEDCGNKDCVYNKKTSHFHCKWISCNKVIPLDEDIFARLDHFQEHELSARITQTSIRRQTANSSSQSKSALKKRGRPPKTNTTFLPQNLINEDLVLQDDKHQKILPSPKNMKYVVYTATNPCPDELCMFRQDLHYHCTSERCHHVTNRLDVINLHSINFHKYITIPENYAYFDRNVNCRGVHCSINRNSCHYHCLRPGCEHSFIRHTTVQQHDKRHEQDAANRPTKSQQTIKLIADNIHQKQANALSTQSTEAGSNSQVAGRIDSIDPAILMLANQLSRLSDAQRTSPDKSSHQQAGKTVVKAAGTFFPQTGRPEDSMGSELADDSSTTSSTVEGDGTTPLVPTHNQQATMMLNLITQMLLLQQKAQQTYNQSQEQTTRDIDDDTWRKMLGRMYSSPAIPCNVASCKKGNVEHYHCIECAITFNTTQEDRLKAHVLKHSRYSGTRQPQTEITNQQIGAGQQAGLHQLLEALTRQQAVTGSSVASSFSAGNGGELRVAVPDSSTEQREDGPPSANTSAMSTGNSIQEMMMRALQLQVINNNNNKNNQTNNNLTNNGASTSNTASETLSLHSNTKQQDIDSSESDEETEEIIPDMYRKFGKSEHCGYSKCTHNGVSVHYHCMRDECTFGVTEASRLSQHTQRHDKLDKIMGDDFRLYKQHTDCGRADCEFSNKASHFHCLLCPYICTDANRILPHRKNHTQTSFSTTA